MLYPLPHLPGCRRLSLTRSFRKHLPSGNLLPWSAHNNSSAHTLILFQTHLSQTYPPGHAHAFIHLCHVNESQLKTLCPNHVRIQTPFPVPQFRYINLQGPFKKIWQFFADYSWFWNTFAEVSRDCMRNLFGTRWRKLGENPADPGKTGIVIPVDNRY